MIRTRRWKDRSWIGPTLGLRSGSSNEERDRGSSSRMRPPGYRSENQNLERGSLARVHSRPERCSNSDPSCPRPLIRTDVRVVGESLMIPWTVLSGRNTYRSRRGGLAQAPGVCAE